MSMNILKYLTCVLHPVIHFCALDVKNGVINTFEKRGLSVGRKLIK